jgi:hypothetical protein
MENQKVKKKIKIGMISIKDVLKIMNNDSKAQIERLQKFISSWIDNKTNKS